MNVRLTFTFINFLNISPESTEMNNDLNLVKSITDHKFVEPKHIFNLEVQDC